MGPAPAQPPGAQPPGAQPPYPQYAPPYAQYGPPPQKETKLAVAGGALVLTGGVLALISSVFSMLFFGLFFGGMGGYPFFPSSFLWFQILCGILGIAFSIIAILGGYFAIKRTHFAMAIVGAIFCLISVGPVFISSLLGLIGLIFIAISSNEFK